MILLNCDRIHRTLKCSMTSATLILLKIPILLFVHAGDREKKIQRIAERSFFLCIKTEERVLFRVEIYYEFKEEPDVLMADSGRETHEIVSRYMPRANFITVTHTETGIQQVFVEGLTWMPSAVNTVCCGNPFPY